MMDVDAVKLLGHMPPRYRERMVNTRCDLPVYSGQREAAVCLNHLLE